MHKKQAYQNPLPPSPPLHRRTPVGSNIEREKTLRFYVSLFTQAATRSTFSYTHSHTEAAQYSQSDLGATEQLDWHLYDVNAE